MPTPSNPTLQPPPPDATTAPRKMRRLHKAGRTIKVLASIFVIAFLCAYTRTYSRYGTAHPQTIASVSHSTPQTFFAPTHSRAPHRRQSFFRPVHQARHHARRTNPYYLASLRRLHRIFSQLLVVRS